MNSLINKYHTVGALRAGCTDEEAKQALYSLINFDKEATKIKDINKMSLLEEYYEFWKMQGLEKPLAVVFAIKDWLWVSDQYSKDSEVTYKTNYLIYSISVTAIPIED